MPEIGVFEVKDKDLAGRIGKLYTPHGVLETPALLPVIDLARQEPSLREISELGFKAVITNAYLIWRRWREEAIEKGVHGILGFDGIVMTDSGAYQLLRYGHVEVSPEEIVEFQKAIGSDIAVILDVPTPAEAPRERAEESVRETLRRARDAIKLIKGDNRIWTLPVQGGPYPDLVARAASEAAALAEWYKLYAIGSPTALLERYSYDKIIEMIAEAKLRLPLSHPVHLFGAGHPMIIPFAVALGVDMFDSASYILYARDNRYMTPSGTKRLEDIDYFPCSCPVCTRYTPQELKEMPSHERVRLLALHNLYVIREEINRVKLAIREGRLWELLVEKAHSHPTLKRALQVLVRYAKFIEKLDPRVKGGEIHGLFLYGIREELYRPEVLRHRDRLRSSYQPRSTTLVLYPLRPEAKPFIASREYTHLRRIHENHDIAAYTPVLGVIPAELSETYPLSQFEAPLVYEPSVLQDLAEKILEFARRYSSVIIYVDEGLEWSTHVATVVKDRLKDKNVEVRSANRDVQV